MPARVGNGGSVHSSGAAEAAASLLQGGGSTTKGGWRIVASIDRTSQQICLDPVRSTPPPAFASVRPTSAPLPPAPRAPSLLALARCLARAT